MEACKTSLFLPVFLPMLVGVAGVVVAVVVGVDVALLVGKFAVPVEVSTETMSISRLAETSCNKCNS